MTQTAANPLMEAFTLRHGAVPFDRVRTEHYMPALDHAIAAAEQEVEAIASNADAPTFENTLAALEESCGDLERVTNLYGGLFAAEGDDELRNLAAEFWPKATDFYTRLTTHPGIFARIEHVYESRDQLDLNPDEFRVLEITYQGFVRNGARLDPAGKKRFQEVYNEISGLYSQFAQNASNDENAFYYHTDDESEVAGIPDGAVELAATEARERGQESGWGFTLREPSCMPVLQFADHRDLREKIWRAMVRVGFGGEYDNVAVLKRLAALRYEIAQLLGYDTHADYVLEERMAAKATTVTSFLQRYQDVAVPTAHKEMDELRDLAKRRDGVENLRPWDVPYYHEKLKKERFDFDSSALRPYFQMDKVVAGIMEISHRLYQITFERVDDLPVYHPDVEVYEVHDPDGGHLGLLYLDLYTRPTKQAGAWMAPYLSDLELEGVHRRPVICVVANLTPATPTSPSLLDLNEVRTIFHEMGHALHFLHGRTPFDSLGSNYVYTDFVELPSQIMENWITEPEALALFAHHHETGELIPMDLVGRVQEAQRFHGGRALSRSLQYELLDWAWHSGNPASIENIEDFEEEVTREIRLLPPEKNHSVSTAFLHIFAGDYAAGYYSYRWAEALEADAFEYFKEEGIFSQEVASKFREHILTQGNREHPAVLYERFRGRPPDPDALLRKFALA